MKTATVCREIPCDQSVAERPRYYAGKVITHYDLSLEQDYFRSKLRRHNRMLHGWGVVCGALVCKLPKSKENGTKFEPWKVVVKPGCLLGPYGDEIIIDCIRTVDLRTQGVVGITGEPCVDAVDPWCSQVVQEPSGGKLYIAVRYKEVPARPVRVQPVGCGCDDGQCENSRYVDGYEIAVLDHCPNSEDTPPGRISTKTGPIPECPPCPDEPWVGLAEVEIDADGNVTIDNCICRRLVVSLANSWWQCSDEQGVARPAPEGGPEGGMNSPAPPVNLPRAVVIRAAQPAERLQPNSENTITVTGENLDMVKRVDFGSGAGIAVAGFEATPTQLVVHVKLDSSAAAGPRSLLLRDADGREVEMKNAVSIEGTVPTGSNPSQPAPANQPPAAKAQASSSKTASKRPRKTPKEEV